MKKGCVYFHQGWTDIVMCMGLINFYKESYDVLYVIIRHDAKELLQFYVRSLTNVFIVSIPTDNGRFHGNIDTNSNRDDVVYEDKTIKISSNFDILFHDMHDPHRKDKYKLASATPAHLRKPSSSFAENFYTYYDIDYINRVKNFNVFRDSILEENVYQDFIKTYGDKYVLYHDDEFNHLNGIHHISTKIKLENIINEYSYVNLNKKSTVFFDYLKVIENAIELHLIDSVWASIIYQLDANTNFLNGKLVYLYCLRNHDYLFEHPVKLNNWIIKK